MRRSPPPSILALEPLFKTLAPLAIAAAFIAILPSGCAHGHTLEGAGGQGGSSDVSGPSGSGFTTTTSTGSHGSSVASAGSGFASSSVTAGPASSSAAGGLGCDDTGDCSTCNACANSNDCAAEANACTSDPDCVAFNSCIKGCNNDSACISDCETLYPSGESTYLDYSFCVLCTACYDDCQGAINGC